MNRRDKIEIKQLAALESEFRETLLMCLNQCARGRWGLFGAYDKFPEIKYWFNWPEVDRLHELAASILRIRSQYGESNALCEEFLKLCTLHSANDPGEPKLARAFLERIEREDRGLEHEEKFEAK